MRDHRPDRDTADAEIRGLRELVDITAQVTAHHDRHPGSVKRSPKADARARARRAKQSRKANR